jgi:hypothetical protein
MGEYTKNGIGWYYPYHKKVKFLDQVNEYIKKFDGVINGQTRWSKIT